MNGNKFHIEGDDYYHGRNGKEQDEEKAVECWLKGAKMDSVQCMKNLSWAYLHGIGVERSKLVADNWADRAVRMEEYQEAKSIEGLVHESIRQVERRKRTKVYPNDIEVGENDIVLLTQYYVDRDCPMREAETDFALKRNLANPSIKKVVLFLEEDIDIPFKSDKVERVFINDWTTYKDGFDYMRGKPGVKLMANSDIYFNPDIISIASAHFDNRILCFLRVNLNPDNGEIEEEAIVHRHKSSDAWAWRELPPFKSNMYLGVQHCENRMLVNAARSGIEVLNMGDIFSAIHVHWNEKRPATNYEGKNNYGPCLIHWRFAEESEVFNCDRNTPRSLIDYIGSSIVSDRIVRDKYLDICDMVYQHEGSSWSTFLRERGYDGEHVEGNKPYYSDDVTDGIMACSNTLLCGIPKTFSGKVVSAWEDNPVVSGTCGRVFATNVVGGDPMVTSIPLGHNFRASKAMAEFVPEVPANEKLMYVNFALRYPQSIDFLGNRDFPQNRTRTEHTNATEIMRQKVFSEYENEPWATSVRVYEWGGYPIGHLQFLQDLYQHKFVLCPEGVGIDTFRVWEALYMKAIPIVKRSDHMLAFSDLPIFFVDDFYGLTQDMLENAYEDMLYREYDFRKLEFSYWKTIIEEMKIEST